MTQGALTGLRLIEMGQLIAGPFCGQLMGDHGAEVIKIEPPKVGDAMRTWGQGVPLWFSVVGRNKKSITLNLREKEGQEIVKRLADDIVFGSMADVVGGTAEEEEEENNGNACGNDWSEDSAPEQGFPPGGGGSRGKRIQNGLGDMRGSGSSR